MKNMKRILALAAAAAMSLSLVGCQAVEEAAEDVEQGAESLVEDAEEEVDKLTGNETYSIGICQLVQHDALDAATQGFIDKLTELIGEDKVTFDNQNASGESTNCTTIINGFVSNGVDLILANATAALQAASAGTSDIPILGTSITEYGVALEVDEWPGNIKNVSGTSDLAPLNEQANMIKELFPDAKTVGLLYCSAEANSQFQVETIEGYLNDLGYTCEYFSFTDSNDVSSVTQSACDACDVIYIPTDNTAASNTEAIANVVLPAGVPVVAGEEGICSGCGVATLSISYYELGETTGEMAYEILVNGADISTMDIEYAPSVTKEYNEANCTTLGITVPDDYEAIATE